MLSQIINLLFQTYTIMIFARIIASWIPELQNNKFMHFIAFYTDPYLNLFRRIIPPLGVIDISPMIAFFALSILNGIIQRLLA